ncbi:unnamed protein product [Brachionus calyciflorus]|uniref:Uncharacterized protein n=1 Tax=Brachionus calyciflorus TaxID=104777 RepID=A0A814GK40_9BILA|nr:unnamed protein product [Brachionus calyciflorus]
MNNKIESKSNANKNQNIYDNEGSFIKALRKGVLLVACRVCGQVHPKESAHLYDYEGTVDDDLICHLCFQPFVDPVDAKCGCTYCSICLQNYLKRFKYCPIDNQKIDSKNCHRASQALRRILDKLSVVCPNIDYCEEYLPRHQLEYHLLTKCKGSVTYCTNANLGCDFQGPRSALSSHLLDCPFKDCTLEIPKEPIIPGKFCEIEIHRGYQDIGLYVVGGCDTPLVTTVIQQIKTESFAEKDGRLQPGDHILKLNGIDLASHKHKEVIELFSQAIPICRMLVYREALEEDEEYDNYEYREEIFRIEIPKQRGQQLGIKLGTRKKEKGIFILHVVKNSLAYHDGKIKVNDRILEINGQNLKYSTKEEAHRIISDSQYVVSMLVSREKAPNLPVLLEHHNHHHHESKSKKSHPGVPLIWQEFNLNLAKEKDEPLGLVVDGGLNSYDNESTPIFVSSLEQKSCIEKSKYIRKADLIISLNEESLIGETKKNAMDMIQNTKENDLVTITYVRCPDNFEESLIFKPSWRYFISIPITYQIAKSVQVFKGSNEFLGLTIAGGKDTNFDKIFIKSVIPNSSAANSKKLRSGDMILSVDGVSLQNSSHSDAVQYLKSVHGLIRFVIISCPGTLI